MASKKNQIVESSSENESDEGSSEKNNIIENEPTRYFEKDYSTLSSCNLTLRTTYSPHSISTTEFNDSSVSIITKRGDNNGYNSRNQSIVREFSREFPKFSKQQMVDNAVSSKLIFKQVECSDCSLLKRKTYHAEKLTKQLKKLNLRKENLFRNTLILKYFYDIFDIPISDKYIKKICFNENLVISFDPGCEQIHNFGASDLNINNNNNDKQLLSDFSIPVGSFSLRIEESNQQFIIYCKSQLEINDTIASTNLISMISDDIGLIEEKKSEWYFENKKKIEKNLHIVMENYQFVAYLDHKDSLHSKSTNRRGELNLQNKGEFVQDGGIYVLMRYLIVKEFVGHIQFWTMDINGKLGLCKMDIGVKRNIIINGTTYKTVLIKKELFRSNVKKEISKTYFLNSGYMVLHKWKGCSYYIHLDNTLPIPNKYEYNLANNWMNDIILSSQFHDEKSQSITKIQTYLNDHPQIKNLLHDYLLFLLLLKPDNILEYTINFFLNMFRDYEKK